MKIDFHSMRQIARKSSPAFTMIEIAISISIIAVALVAIAGVLPAGMQVQRENREETIVVEDGKYLLETIRNGNEGVFNLVTHIDAIKISNLADGTAEVFTREILSNDWTSARVIGLLSSKQYLEVNTNQFEKIYAVTAEVKAMNGSALEQSPTFDDVAFRYLMEIEIAPYESIYAADPSLATSLTNTPGGVRELERNYQLQANLYQIRLKMNWPLRLNNSPGMRTAGNKELEFSSMVGGSQVPFILPGNSDPVDPVTGRTLYRFDPTVFTPKL